MHEGRMEVALAIQTLEAAGWPELSDRLLQGFCHTLNGRISSLMGLLYLARKRGPEDPTLIQAMETEMDRLEEVVKLMERAPHDGTEGAEALSLAELLPGIFQLHLRQKGMEVLELEHRIVDLPPVLLNRTVLTRLLLLLLSRVSEKARAAGSGSVFITGTPGGGGASLRMGPGDEGTDDPEASTTGTARPGLSFRDGMLDRLREVAEGFGGRLEVEGEGRSVELWLPSLQEARGRGS